MALCGAGCMGFVNVADGLRAMGYIERDELPLGPIALVTHSGSVFSTLLRTRRALGFTLAVSSGQELVTTTADYLDHVLDQTETRVLALVLETVRDGARLRGGAAPRREADIPGGAAGRRVPARLLDWWPHTPARSPARTAAWEALAEGDGRAARRDLAELADTLELLAIGRRAARPAPGIATVHDSGAERTLVADSRRRSRRPFAPMPDGTRDRSRPPRRRPRGGEPARRLGHRRRYPRAVRRLSAAMAADPAVSAAALAVDLVEEYDGDTPTPTPCSTWPPRRAAGRPRELRARRSTKRRPRLRAHGVPVLEGTRSGLVALRHLLALATEPAPDRRSRSGSAVAAWLASGRRSTRRVVRAARRLRHPRAPTRAVASADGGRGRGAGARLAGRAQDRGGRSRTSAMSVASCSGSPT